ncbi:histidine phosphatase family protein [Candidatus Kaiserbacteria bacterium]|nr:histidine phosphatase family protein [Candidatus Kaiserbacteria bacterium]
MKDKIVYFVRHGESEGNVTPIFQSPDSPLNEKGKKQAESIANRVLRLQFDALVASPLQRTKETAEMIAKATGKPIEYSSLFVERIKPTYINGKPYADERADALWKKWQESLCTPGMRVEDGENFDDLVIRADKALSFLAGRSEQSIVVVTHGYFLRTIVACVLLGDLLSGEAHRRIQIAASMENTGLTVLRYFVDAEEGLKEPTWNLWIYNDHAHLG